MDLTKMTNEEINRRVAVEVMGWRSTMGRPTHWGELHAIDNLITGETHEPYRGPWFIPPGMSWGDSPTNGIQVPNYCGDIGEAWKVVEKIKVLRTVSIDVGANVTAVRIDGVVRAKHDSAARAICLASLSALGREDKGGIQQDHPA